jgi:hypothetical protein
MNRLWNQVNLETASFGDAVKIKQCEGHARFVVTKERYKRSLISSS